MTQMIHNIVAFKSAEPVSRHGHMAAGVLTWLVARLRSYLARRRTLRAFDRLDDAMLKDIGYRRIPGEYSKYEPIH
jgi:uncharacterized protein YjiS (DUF1127 family)